MRSVCCVGLLAALACSAVLSVSAAEPRRGGPRAPAEPIATQTLAKSPAEQKILTVLDDLFQNQRRGMLNVPLADGRLLRVLAEAIGAKNIVEIGMSNGYSGLWFCLALRSTGGHLTTHDIDPQRIALARENFRRAGVEDLVTIVEGDAHEKITQLKGPVDLVFIDADKAGYADYLKKMLPLVRPGGLILAHNTSNQGGDMADFIKAITTDPNLETMILNPEPSGVAVVLKKR